jgi:hypothetical protein
MALLDRASWKMNGKDELGALLEAFVDEVSVASL